MDMTMISLWNKTVTLYIDDTHIQLLVIKGNQVKKWADLQLEPGLVQGGAIIDVPEVAARIKRILKEQKVNTRKVTIGFSGIHCFSHPIVLPQLPRAMMEEAVTREAKRVLPVPLENLYMAWQSIPGTNGKSKVFIVATPRKTIDSLFKTLTQAGLKPKLIDIKPLALASILEEPTAILVDVRTAEFDIVVVSGGIPQPIRTISFPSQTLTTEEKLPVVKNDLNVTIDFYNSKNPDQLIDSSVPIYVTGELSKEIELHNSLSSDLGHPLIPLPSPFKSPAEIDSPKYMVNIGLANKQNPPGRNHSALAVNMNLIPTEYQPKPISLTRILVVPSIVVIAGLIFLAMSYLQSNSAHIADLNGQLNVNNQLIKQKQAQRQELNTSITKLKKDLTDTIAMTESLDTTWDDIQIQQNRVDGDLDTITKLLPKVVYLTSVNLGSDNVTLTGSSPTETELIDYARLLDNSKRFINVTIASIKETSDGRMGFILVLKLT